MVSPHGFQCTKQKNKQNKQKTQSRVGLNPFCSTLQGVVGCAVKTVSSCPAVTASAADSFISRANRLTLRAASTGCGDPQICE